MPTECKTQAHCKSPCDQCPWRKDRIGQFKPARYRALVNTAYDMASEIFTCHKSGEDSPVICAGFLLNGAAHNLAIRMMAIRGQIDWGSVSDGGHKLHADYRAMAVANGVKRSDPVLRECR